MPVVLTILHSWLQNFKCYIQKRYVTKLGRVPYEHHIPVHKK